MASAEAVAGAVRTTPRAAAVLRQGFVIGVTNPKSTVFFLAVLPQFVDPADGPVPLQMLVLGCVFVLATLSVGTAVALVAGSARDRFVRSPDHLATATGAGGALMILLAVILLVWRCFAAHAKSTVSGPEFRHSAGPLSRRTRLCRGFGTAPRSGVALPWPAAEERKSAAQLILKRSVSFFSDPESERPCGADRPLVCSGTRLHGSGRHPIGVHSEEAH
ncbi:LysE family translocator [Streptomyces sp. YPW6]|uniref:LysE family translocator n=1 Tax=Streptomyces sp. YPW6 TaxID=2840373 RepID=UPI003D703349